MFWCKSVSETKDTFISETVTYLQMLGFFLPFQTYHVIIKLCITLINNNSGIPWRIPCKILIMLKCFLWLWSHWQCLFLALKMLDILIARCHIIHSGAPGIQHIITQRLPHVHLCIHISTHHCYSLLDSYIINTSSKHHDLFLYLFF